MDFDSVASSCPNKSSLQNMVIEGATDWYMWLQKNSKLKSRFLEL
jgi:hypothetical protein